MRTTRQYVSFALIIVVLTALFGGAVMAQEDGGAIPVDDVLDDPEVYYGQTVTVIGDLIDVGVYEVGTAAIEDDDIIAAEELPVFLSQNASLDFTTFEEDTRVQATGIIRQFVRADFEAEFGLDLSDPYYEDYESQPVMIVDSMMLIEGDGEGTAGTLTLDDILDNPEAYYGQSVTVEGDLVNVDTFEVGTAAIEDDDFLVADEMPIFLGQNVGNIDFATFEEDTSVRATGTVRQFVSADFQNEFGYVLDDPYYADYEGQPVMIVDSLVPLEADATAVEGEMAPESGMENAGMAAELTADTITDDPLQYYGQVVTVTGELVSVNEFAQGTAAIEDTDILNPERIPLFLSGEAAGLDMTTFEEDADVRATGRLVRFRRADFETQLGYDLSNEFYTDYEGGPALVVDTITVMDE